MSELTPEQKKSAGIVPIHGQDYQTVALRIKTMKEDHAGWGIQTKVTFSDADHVLVRARIVNEHGFLMGSGHAEENRHAGQINKTSALENCETSAVGRALSMAGYLGTEIRSAEEMLTAVSQQSLSEVISEYFIDRLVDDIDACFEIVKGSRGQDQVNCENETLLKEYLSIANEIKDDDRELKQRVWRKLPSLIRSYISDMEKS